MSRSLSHDTEERARPGPGPCRWSSPLFCDHHDFVLMMDLFLLFGVVCWFTSSAAQERRRTEAMDADGGAGAGAGAGASAGAVPRPPPSSAPSGPGPGTGSSSGSGPEHDPVPPPPPITAAIARSSSKVGGAAVMPPVDSKAWSGFLHNFTQVHYLLDHNRLLLHEINLNQESKIPESLTRNVLLTRELTNNIAKVAELYTKISDTCETLGIQMEL